MLAHTVVRPLAADGEPDPDAQGFAQICGISTLVLGRSGGCLK
jgi:hypothetical protein